jgi:hypothetical protein
MDMAPGLAKGGENLSCLLVSKPPLIDPVTEALMGLRI